MRRRAVALVAAVFVAPATAAHRTGPSQIVFESEAKQSYVAKGVHTYRYVHDLYAVNPDGTVFARLPGPAESRAQPSWSPDGSKLVYVGPKGLRIQVVGAHGPRYLPGADGKPLAGSFPAWSPDGARIAYVGFDGVYVVAVSGGKAMHVAKANVYGRISWSPDGRIAFVDHVQTSRYGGDSYLRIVQADGTGLTTPAVTPSTVYDPAWSPDGTRIAVTRYDGSTTPGANEIFTLAPDGNGPTELTHVPKGVEQAAWSPDGQQLVVQTTDSRSAGTYGIAVVNADGSGFKELAPASKGRSYFYPTW